VRRYKKTNGGTFYMNAKIERVNKEIDKTKEKISEQQARLRDLEKQKTELENLDIVSTVRGMNISFTDLAEVLKLANVTSGQVGPKSTAKLPANVPTSNNDDKEDEE